MPTDSEHGKKIAAGKLLSKFLREILNEEYDDPIVKAKGEEAVMVTKAEVIARHIVRAATGYTEDVDVLDKDGKKTGIKTVYHRPDKTYIGLIYDRLEGRASMMDAKSGSDKAKLSDRVSEQGKKRLSQIAIGSLTSKELSI